MHRSTVFPHVFHSQIRSLLSLLQECRQGAVMDLMWKESPPGHNPPEQKGKADFSLLTQQRKGTQHAPDQTEVLCAGHLQ